MVAQSRRQAKSTGLKTRHYVGLKSRRFVLVTCRGDWAGGGNNRARAPIDLAGSPPSRRPGGGVAVFRQIDCPEIKLSGITRFHANVRQLLRHVHRQLAFRFFAACRAQNPPEFPLLLHCSLHGTATPRPALPGKRPMARRDRARHPCLTTFHRAAPGDARRLRVPAGSGRAWFASPGSWGRSTLLDRNWFGPR